MGKDATVAVTDDRQLVRDARAGDHAAFEELVRRHAGRLHVVVRHLVDSAHDADEVTQEAFLRAWRGIGRFKGDAAFSTWLYRIGVNEAHRRRERAPSPQRETPLDEQVVEPRESRPGPAGAAEHSALRTALERAIADLHPDLRVPLVLRDVEGLTTADAAAVMELGEAAFKSRLHRARLTVRTAVASHLPDPQ
jgi:RNA polymerase sigma-70 factor (ECF subfamily)